MILNLPDGRRVLTTKKTPQEIIQEIKLKNLLPNNPSTSLTLLDPKSLTLLKDNDPFPETLKPFSEIKVLFDSDYKKHCSQIQLKKQNNEHQSNSSIIHELDDNEYQLLTQDCLPYYLSNSIADDISTPQKLLDSITRNIRQKSKYTFEIRFFREMTVKWDKNIQQMNVNEAVQQVFDPEKQYYLQVKCEKHGCRFSLLYQVFGGEATLFWQNLMHCFHDPYQKVRQALQNQQHPSMVQNSGLNLNQEKMKRINSLLASKNLAAQKAQTQNANLQSLESLNESIGDQKVMASNYEMAPTIYHIMEEILKLYFANSGQPNQILDKSKILNKFGNNELNLRFVNQAQNQFFQNSLITKDFPPPTDCPLTNQQQIFEFYVDSQNSFKLLDITQIMKVGFSKGSLNYLKCLEPVEFQYQQILEYAKRNNYWYGDKQKIAMATHSNRQIKRVQVAKQVYKFFEQKFEESGKSVFWKLDQVCGGEERQKANEQMNLMAALGLVCIQKVQGGENVYRWQGYNGFNDKYIVQRF